MCRSDPDARWAPGRLCAALIVRSCDSRQKKYRQAESHLIVGEHALAIYPFMSAIDEGPLDPARYRLIPLSAACSS